MNNIIKVTEIYSLFFSSFFDMLFFVQLGMFGNHLCDWEFFVYVLIQLYASYVLQSNLAFFSH